MLDVPLSDPSRAHEASKTHKDVIRYMGRRFWRSRWYAPLLPIILFWLESERIE